MTDGGRRMLDEERGQSLVEFGVSSVLFFTVVFGVMNFAVAMYDYHLIDDAARSAARFAIVRGSASPAPATAADIQAFVDSRGLKGATAKTTWTPNNAPGSTVTVEVRFDFQPIAPLVPSVVLPLASTAQMVISQ